MRALLLAAAGLLAACGDDPLDLDIAPECNPLGSGDGCALPWPAGLYERADAASPTGVWLDLPPGSLPETVDGLATDVAPLNTRDGWSPLSQVLATFEGGVDVASLIGWDRIGDSIAADASTVILDVATGERVAHFAEVDANTADGDGDDQALYLRPAARLASGARYAVAIRRGVTARGGGALARPAGFQALLDGTATTHARLEAYRPRHAAAVAALVAAGIPEDDLVLAWDFTVSTPATFATDQATARDVAVAAHGAAAANVTYTVTLDEQPDSRDAEIARRIHIDYLTPKIATSDGFVRDGAGQITTDGTQLAPATILVPACATPGNKAGIVIYGHGFFGGLDESEGGYPRRFAKTTCNVVIGGLWRGMAEDDIPNALGALNDINRARRFAEGVWQGITDFMALAALAKHRLPTELLVNGSGGGAQSIVDPERIAFYGISQGAILGAVYFPHDPTLTRGVLNVGGGNWSILFERSTNWAEYGVPLKGAYGGELPSVIAQQIVTMGFEVIDGGANADTLLTGAMPKHYLQQMAVGDALVTNLSSLFHARSAGWPLLTPSVQEPFGVTPAAGPLPSALVIYDEEPTPLPPVTNLVNSVDNVAHENVRRRPAVMEQVDHFVDTGEIIQTCTGACACADGACGALP